MLSNARGKHAYPHECSPTGGTLGATILVNQTAPHALPAALSELSRSAWLLLEQGAPAHGSSGQPKMQVRCQLSDTFRLRHHFRVWVAAWHECQHSGLSVAVAA